MNETVLVRFHESSSDRQSPLTLRSPPLVAKGVVGFFSESRTDNGSLLPGVSGWRQRRPDFVAGYLADVPSQTFTHRTRTTASPGEVWKSLDRPETWEAIGRVDRVFDPKVDDQGRLRGFSFETVAGGKRYLGVATPHERVEGETMAWNVENSEVRGTTSVRIEGSGETTIISVTLQLNSTGLLSAMFFPVIAKAIGQGLPESVESFAAGFAE